MKNAILIISILLVSALSIKAQQSNFPELTGPYLGQKPPGKTPEFFAFSPDGKYLFYMNEGIWWVSATFFDNFSPLK